MHLGQMHACGHDGHTAVLLGFAQYLDALQEDFPCNVLCIFQPVEEATGGAKDICETGMFKKYRISRVFGLHLWPFTEKTHTVSMKYMALKKVAMGLP